MDRTAAAEAVKARRLEGWVLDHGAAILRTCFLYLSDRSLAEDAAQDTFLKAWQNMDQFDGSRGTSEKAWLMRIAINTCHDLHRSRWFRHVDMRKALEDLPPRYLRVEDPEQDELILDIMALPRKQKEVILLYYYQEMRLEEIAQALGVRASTVHYRLKKARTLLKNQLTGGDAHAGKANQTSHR